MIPRTSHFQVRRYAIVTAAGIGAAKAATGAGAAAAGGGALLRLLGVDIGWPAIVGASMAAAFGAYAWGTKKIADADRKPVDLF